MATTTREPEAPMGMTTGCNNAALRMASRRISQLYDRAMAPSGLRITQFGIMNQIDRRGPLALSELAQFLAMDRSTLGHNLRPLEREGLVALVVDEHDRRSRRIGLTTQGKRKLLSARKHWVVAQTDFEATFGIEKAKALRDVLLVLASEEFADAFGKPLEGKSDHAPQ